MFDPVYVLDKLGLKPGMSVTRAISKIGLDISESADPLRAANKIIVALNGNQAANPIHADIVAKALIEQAVIFGESYNADKAMNIANEKYDKIKRTMPYVFAGSSEDLAPKRQVEVKQKRGGDKKARALEIFNREKGKENGEIAKVIAAELEITYANAYYYVTRVFKG